jgi:hypothetical protein
MNILSPPAPSTAAVPRPVLKKTTASAPYECHNGSQEIRHETLGKVR